MPEIKPPAASSKVALEPQTSPLQGEESIPPISARLSPKEFWNSTSTSRLEHLIKALDSDPILATKRLLRKLRHVDAIYDHDPREIKLLTESLPQIIGKALEYPEFHSKLLDTLYLNYNAKKSGPVDRKELLQEVLNQLNTSGDSQPNLTKAKFLSRFISHMRPKGSQLKFSLYVHLRDDGEETFVYDLKDILHASGFDDFYKSKDLDADSMFGRLYSDHEKGVKVEELNMLQILALEQQYPGICSRLQSKYGINDFYRYPEKLLVELDKTGEDASIARRVLVIVAADDHNGAFSNPRDYTHLLRLKRYGIAPLLLEVDSTDELEELVEKMDPAIRDSIFQTVVKAHGQRNAIQFGKSRNGVLYTWNIDPFTRIFNEKLSKVRNIILDSCSTGAKGKKGSEDVSNIAEIIAQNLVEDVIVNAPPTVASSINLVTRDGIKYIPRKVLPRRKKTYRSTGKKKED